jgi:hypothetical protein
MWDVKKRRSLPGLREVFVGWWCYRYCVVVHGGGCRPGEEAVEKGKKKVIVWLIEAPGLGLSLLPKLLVVKGGV